MKRNRLLLTFVMLLISVAPAWAQAPVPKLKGRVNDYANLLSQSQIQQLESVLAQFEQQTTTQVVLLTVPSLEGDAVESFGIRVAEAWKIGQTGKNNGVVLIVAPKERKVRIEVGYGLEGVLTDLQSSRIIREVITPAFKEGNLYTGIAGGLDAIMKATQGEFQAPAERGRNVHTSGGSVLTMILGIIIFILLISTRTGRFILFTSMMFGGRGGRSSGFGGGGGFSGGGGSFGGGGASGSW